MDKIGLCCYSEQIYRLEMGNDQLEITVKNSTRENFLGSKIAVNVIRRPENETFEPKVKEINLNGANSAYSNK